MTPVRFILGDGLDTPLVDALVGRRRTPLAQVDPGLRARIDQAVTDHCGPLPLDALLTDDGRLVSR